ncbi:MAG: 30S ribosomal protein S16 [Microgenomates group bacterium]
MVKIRLARGGVKNNPFYRIVVIDEKRKRGGKPLEIVGFWHPAKDIIKIDKKKIKDWVGKGAQVTQAVKKLLEKK